MRVVIVEDHPLIRTGLRTSLRAIGIDVVGEGEDGVSALALVREMRPDIAIVDLGLPGIDGIALLRELKADTSPPRVVVLSMREEDEDVLAAVAAGADGYCAKSSGHHVIMDAVRIVLRRLSGNSPAPENSPLAARERVILTMIAEGTSNADIAERMHLPLGTVKSHISDILRKLNASDRAHAAVIALRGGYL
jgi:NarL family two-component system response regulator LiaR